MSCTMAAVYRLCCHKIAPCLAWTLCWDPVTCDTEAVAYYRCAPDMSDMRQGAAATWDCLARGQHSTHFMMLPSKLTLAMSQSRMQRNFIKSLCLLSQRLKHRTSHRFGS